MHRRSRRNRIDRGRHGIRDMPRTTRRARGEPDPVSDGEELRRRGLDHRRRGVHRIRQRRARDPDKLRRTVVDHFQRGALARHGRRLRDGGGNRGLFGLRRAGHGDERIRVRVVGSDLCEVCGEALAVDEGPRPVQRCRAEPAARQQQVVMVVARLDEERVVCVGDGQQIHALHRLQRRLAVRHDQLGRLRGDHHVRCLHRLLAVGGQHRVGLQIRLRFVCGGDQLMRRRCIQMPRTVERCRLVPVARGIQMQRAARVLEQHRSRVDQALIVRVAQRTPVRVAIDQHQQRGAFGEDNVGYVVLHREAGFAAFVGAGITGLQLLERGGQAVFRNPRLQGRFHPGCGTRRSRHIDLVENDIEQLHRRAGLVDFSARREMRHAVVRRRALRADRESRAALNAVALPHFDLRLIQLDALLGAIEVARPDGRKGLQCGLHRGGGERLSRRGERHRQRRANAGEQQQGSLHRGFHGA